MQRMKKQKKRHPKIKQLMQSNWCFNFENWFLFAAQVRVRHTTWWGERHERKAKPNVTYNWWRNKYNLWCDAGFQLASLDKDNSFFLKTMAIGIQSMALVIELRMVRKTKRHRRMKVFVKILGNWLSRMMNFEGWLWYSRKSHKFFTHLEHRAWFSSKMRS